MLCLSRESGEFMTETSIRIAHGGDVDAVGYLFDLYRKFYDPGIPHLCSRTELEQLRTFLQSPDFFLFDTKDCRDQ